MSESAAGRCAVAARARHDPLVATAAPATRWLLVEQTGPWGREALTESRLDPEVGATLLARSRAARGRALLIRRHGRQPDGPRRWAVVDARPGHETLRWGSVSSDRELLDVPLDGSGGTASTDPVYLVCTHGRHDRCCAQDGRPVALALQDLRPDHVWECSHLGGDRFAGNVLVLPWGLGYGRVAPTDVPGLVRATEDGRLLPDLLRGRSSLSPPAQAAQYLAGAEMGRDAIDDLLPRSEEAVGPSTWRVLLSTGAGLAACTVRSRPSTWTARLTCAATHPSPQREWELLELHLTTAAGSDAVA